MHLMRIGAAGAGRPVVRVDDTHYVDVSDAVADFDEAFFGSAGVARLAGLVDEHIAAGDLHPFGDQRIGAPIARPHQILCIGLNYSDHAAETGQAVPDEPVLCTKSPNTLVGPHDDARIPRVDEDRLRNLAMWLDVNGVRRQTGSTKMMVFDPYVIVHYLSQFILLEPGDLINTARRPVSGWATSRRSGCGRGASWSWASTGSASRGSESSALGRARTVRAALNGTRPGCTTSPRTLPPARRSSARPGRTEYDGPRVGGLSAFSGDRR